MVARDEAVKRGQPLAPGSVESNELKVVATCVGLNLKSKQDDTTPLLNTWQTFNMITCTYIGEWHRVTYCMP